MPHNEQEINKSKEKFYQLYRFPGVIGRIDCTHIPITAPPENEYTYVNRNGFHSFNVQATCDADMVFSDVVVILML